MRRRLAEDMYRRGEASEGTLPKATRRARKRVRSPHRWVSLHGETAFFAPLHKLQYVK